MIKKKERVVWLVRAYSNKEKTHIYSEIKVKATHREKVKIFLDNMSDKDKVKYNWNPVNKTWVTIGRQWKHI